MDHKDLLTSSNSYHQQYLSRMGRYHMSRQNPDVLDHMYASQATPTPQPPSTQQTRNFHRELIYTPQKSRPHHTAILGPYAVPADLNSVPPQPSLLRQMLNARRAQSSSPSNSVVQFATRNGRRGRVGGGLLKRGLVSPVVVRLAGVRRRGDETCGGRERGWDGEDAGRFEREARDGRDPCDKEVVLDALRQKR